MENPLILAIETSGRVGGIALIKEKLLGAVSLSSRESYSKAIFKTLNFITEFLHLSIEEVDYYAIDIGPGSFTGLRIGLSVLKGLSLVYPRPVIPVCSLEVLAANFIGHPLPIAALVNAYSKEVFFAVYKWFDFRLETEIEPHCLPLKEIPEYIKEPCLFVSETPEVWEEILSKKLGSFYIKPKVPVNLSPELVAKLAIFKLKQGKTELKNAEEVLPLYLKASEAERKKQLKVV